MHTAREHGWTLDILESVNRVNERQKGLLADKIIARIGPSLAGKTVALWGLAFKPGTDDVREAPALTVIERLLAAGAVVHGHDPVANDCARKLLGDRIRYYDNNYDAANGAHALALMTEWHQFRRPNFRKLKERMGALHLFDGRNIWEPAEVRALGFTYEGIGRP
jgi:UDPglucose 6-dehydrogenase